MTIAESGHWFLPEDIGASDLCQRVNSALRADLGPERRQNLVLHDSFAWQLWHQGKVLCRFDDTYALCHYQTLSCEEAVATCEAAGELPRFWWDWPSNTMRKSLQPLLDVRALIPVAEVSVVTRRIDLKNADDKTVARVIVQHFERPDGARKQTVGMCRTVPIRGYDGEHEELDRALESCGFAACTTPPVEIILEQAGCRPASWSGKPDCPMTAEMTCREAVRQLATASLDICKRCEAGVIVDMDTEFLHDYRVNLRRLRSILKLVKKTYPGEVVKDLLATLGGFARRTNRLRDLDVYLLKRSAYMACTPPYLQDALVGMFEDLQRERCGEQEAVAAHLGSSEYRTAMQRMMDVFDDGRWWPVTVNSHSPALAIATRVLPKRYERICRMQASIGVDSPDEEIHDVRLEAKKLRYLLEFFGGLFPRVPVGRLIKRLKKMQNILGEFNDLAVQQESLRAYVLSRAESDGGNTELVLAVGSLLGILHREQQEVRSQVFRRLEEFSADETQALVRDLFKEGSRAA